MFKNCLFFAIILVIFVLPAAGVLAEELHIDKDGNYRLISAQVINTNNNFLMVKIWGMKLEVYIDIDSKVIDAGGLALPVSGIKVGHLISVEGKYNDDNKNINARMVSDESVGSPNPQIQAMFFPTTFAAAAAINAVVGSKISAPVAGSSASVASPNANATVIATNNVGVLMPKPLQFRVSGSEVTALQNFLVKNGFLTSDNITGYFGPVTVAAVKTFQKSQGLEETGGVGPKTRALIDAGVVASTTVKNVIPAPANASVNASDAARFNRYLGLYYQGLEVKKLQQFLAARGFLASDNVTGTFGQATLQAVKEFQRSKGIEPTGAVGPATRAAMNEMLGQ